MKINKLTPDMVSLRYIMKDTYPYSIDSGIQGGTIETMEVYRGDTYVKNNKRYYRQVIGHGLSSELLIEEE